MSFRGQMAKLFGVTRDAGKTKVDSLQATTGTITTLTATTLTPTTVTRSGQQYVQNAAGARAGATAGWVVTGTDTGMATCPASQTAATLIVPVTIPLKVGSIITAFSVIAQIESAGGAVTLDAALYKVTNAAADPTSASIGGITQVSVTADTAVASSKTLAAAETVAATETFYFLVTATTAASTDIALQGFTVTVTES